jgi:hypothetical protein
MKYSPPRRHRGVWQRAGGLHPLGWVGGETGNGELVDVAVECAVLAITRKKVLRPNTPSKLTRVNCRPMVRD